MQIPVRTTIMLLAFSMAANAGGCVAPALVATAGVSAGVAAARGGTSTYVNGELRAARLATLDESWDAVIAAFDDLEAEILVQREDKGDRVIRARDPQGPSIRVRLQRRTAVATNIRIRVGFIGDPALSRLVLERIDTRLEPRIRPRIERIRQDAGASPPPAPES